MAYTKDSELVQAIVDRITDVAAMPLDEASESEAVAAILNAHAAPPREWTAEDVAAEQANAWFREFNFMFDEDSPQVDDVKEMIATAANIMSVPRTLAVDVDRLGVVIGNACFQWEIDDDDARGFHEVAADVLRRELPAATQPEPAELARLRLVEALVAQFVTSTASGYTTQGVVEFQRAASVLLKKGEGGA